MLVDFSLYRDEIELLANTRSLTFYVPGAHFLGRPTAIWEILNIS